MMCGSQNPTTPTVFLPLLNTTKVYDHAVWTKPATNSTLVNGFFTGCTSLEALLVSTLACLYDNQCIQTLIAYFPALTQVCIAEFVFLILILSSSVQSNFNWTNSSLNADRRNISVYDNLLDLFVEEWSTQVNYSQYFDECASLSCSYIVTDQRDLSYAFTMFISLYGGLIIILRLIAPSLIKLFSKIEKCVVRRNFCVSMYLKIAKSVLMMTMSCHG